MKKAGFVPGVALGLILGFAVAASAATFTITIPQSLVTRYVDAWSIGKGWTPSEALSQSDYAKLMVKGALADQVIRYESIGAGSTASTNAQTQAEIDTAAITVE